MLRHLINLTRQDDPPVAMTKYERLLSILASTQLSLLSAPGDFSGATSPLTSVEMIDDYITAMLREAVGRFTTHGEDLPERLDVDVFFDASTYHLHPDVDEYTHPFNLGDIGYPSIGLPRPSANVTPAGTSGAARDTAPDQNDYGEILARVLSQLSDVQTQGQTQM